MSKWQKRTVPICHNRKNASSLAEKMMPNRQKGQGNAARKTVRHSDRLALIEKNDARMAGKWQCQTGIRKNNAGRLEMRCQNGEKD